MRREDFVSSWLEVTQELKEIHDKLSEIDDRINNEIAIINAFSCEAWARLKKLSPKITDLHEAYKKHRRSLS